MKKEKWWKEVWSDWQAKPWFYITVAIGGAAVVGGLTSYILNWPYIFGAEWWEVTTTIGTVSATVVALGLGYWSLRRSDLENLRKANVTGWLVIPWLGAIKLGSEHAIELCENLEKGIIREYEEFLMKEALSTLNVKDKVSPFLDGLGLHKYGSLVAEIISKAWQLHDLLIGIDIGNKIEVEEMRKNNVFNYFKEEFHILREKIDTLQSTLEN